MPKIIHKNNTSYVYKITNLVNKKIYIGITNQTPQYRFRQHINHADRGGTNHFARAIRKYGKQNFKLEEIEICKTYEDAQEFEKLYIEQYNSIIDGYNMSAGGGGSVGFKIREETKAKLRGRIVSLETRKKLSDSSKGNTKWVGLKHTDTTKKKQSEVRKKIWSQLSEEERAKQSKRFASLSYTSFKGKKHKDSTKKLMAEQKWTLTPEQRLMSALMWEEGITQKAIAKMMNTTRSTILRACREFNLKRENYNLDIDKIENLYFYKKKKLKEIAKIMNTSIPTVSRVLVKIKETKNISTHRRNNFNMQEIKYYLNEGMALGEIAKKLNITYNAMYDFVTKNNLSKRNLNEEKKIEHPLIIKLLKQGVTQQKIADQFKCSRARIGAIAIKNNLRRRIN